MRFWILLGVLACLSAGCSSAATSAADNGGSDDGGTDGGVWGDAWGGGVSPDGGLEGGLGSSDGGSTTTPTPTAPPPATTPGSGAPLVVLTQAQADAALLYQFMPAGVAPSPAIETNAINVPYSDALAAIVPGTVILASASSDPELAQAENWADNAPGAPSLDGPPSPTTVSVLLHNVYGFSRVATNAPFKDADGSLWIQTDAAALPDVIPEVVSDWSGTLDLGKQTLLDASGKTIYGDSDMSIALSTATITDAPIANVQLRVHNGKIERFGFSLQDKLAFSLVVSADAKAGKSAQLTQNLFRTAYHLPPQFVGGVPLVETIQVSVDVDCSAAINGSAHVQAGIVVDEPLILGALFENGTWTNVSSVPLPTATPVLPSAAVNVSSNVKCALVPKFAVLFYDLVGPALTVTTSAQLFTDVSINLGGTSSTAFGYKLDGETEAHLSLDTNGILGEALHATSSLSDALSSLDMSVYHVHGTLASGTF